MKLYELVWYLSHPIEGEKEEPREPLLPLIEERY